MVFAVLLVVRSHFRTAELHGGLAREFPFLKEHHERCQMPGFPQKKESVRRAASRLCLLNSFLGSRRVGGFDMSAM